MIVEVGTIVEGVVARLASEWSQAFKGGKEGRLNIPLGGAQARDYS